METKNNPKRDIIAKHNEIIEKTTGTVTADKLRTIANGKKKS